MDLAGVDVDRGGAARAVGVDRGEHAGLGEDRSRIRDRVIAFELEAPAIGEDAGGYAGLGKLGRDLVGFESVLHRADLEAEFLAQPDHHEDLVGTVAVAVDPDLPAQDVGERLQAQVALGRLALLV
jgi:hypothetical protein